MVHREGGDSKQSHGQGFGNRVRRQAGREQDRTGTRTCTLSWSCVEGVLDARKRCVRVLALVQATRIAIRMKLRRSLFVCAHDKQEA